MWDQTLNCHAFLNYLNNANSRIIKPGTVVGSMGCKEARTVCSERCVKQFICNKLSGVTVTVVCYFGQTHEQIMLSLENIVKCSYNLKQILVDNTQETIQCKVNVTRCSGF